MLDPKFVILGAGFNLFGSLGYVLDTLRGTTKPNRISWFFWALAPLIAFSAELNKGVGLQALMTFMAGFCPLLIFAASFANKKSVWKLTRFDISCGILSFAGLVFWFITREGNVAIAASILADAFAAVPTLVKSYKAPKTESVFAFFTAGLSAFITLLTIDRWDFATCAFPIYIFLICALFSVLIKFELGQKIQSRLFSA